MKTFEEFKESLESHLEKLEAYREEELVRAKNTQIWYVFPAIIAIVSIYVYWNVNPIFAFIIFGIAVGVGSQIALKMVAQPSEEYEETFKKKIFSLLVKEINSRNSYSYSKNISNKTLLNSELFERTENFEGQDYFKGFTEEGSKFQFSEISCLAVSSHEKEQSWFYGLFFELEMAVNYQSKVIVLPSKGKKSPSEVNELEQLSLQGLTAEGEMVAVANVYPKFEKSYKVYSHSKEMAYNILTPQIIEGIYEIKKKWKLAPRLSFINNKIYLALDFVEGQDLFEVSIHQSLLNEEVLQRFYDDLSLCFDILSHLDVHTQKASSFEAKEVKKEQKRTIDLDGLDSIFE